MTLFKGTKSPKEPKLDPLKIHLSNVDQNPYCTLTEDSHSRHLLIFLRDVGLINAGSFVLREGKQQVSQPWQILEPSPPKLMKH
jgi:hypothetical protein